MKTFLLYVLIPSTQCVACQNYHNLSDAGSIILASHQATGSNSSSWSLFRRVQLSIYRAGY